MVLGQVMKVELQAGATVAGKYRIERLLGRGAIGSVYAAEQLETKKRVALKCVDVAQAFDPALAERLLREAQAAARVRHPNVVDIYDVGRDGELFFLVMEYLEGEPLSYAIARRDLPVHALIALLLPAMRGVAEVHRQGVVHRDIKPDNIFLARQLDAQQPCAIVLDFGISKLQTRGSKLRTLTADGYAIGTPGYMAYEQALGDKDIDARVDVYAFGAILYEALTGRVPHAAEDFPSLLRQFLNQPVVPPLELRPELPRSLSALVMWALERDRQQRVSSMEAFIQELEPFATERGYRAELSALTSAPEHGGTLRGPWGLQRTVASGRPGAGSAAQVASIIIAHLFGLGELCRRYARKLQLAALGVAMIGLLGLGLRAVIGRVPAPQRSAAPTSPLPVTDRARPQPSAIGGVTPLPSPEPRPAAELAPPSAERAGDVTPQALAVTAPPANAALVPPAAPLPAAGPPPVPRPAAQHLKPLNKPRDLGIY